MTRAAPALALLLLFGGCDRDESKADRPPTRESGGGFLTEPAGVPPDPLVPTMMELQVRTAEDPEALHKAAREQYPAVWTLHDASVGDFLAQYSAWYAPLDQLRALSDHMTRGEEGDAPEVTPEPPRLPVPAPVVRVPIADQASFSPSKALELTRAGGRGNLVLWYPLMTLRERLADGTTGMWRGITRFRDELGGAPQLGGTPVFLMSAVAAPDVVLLDGPPSGYKAMVTADAWLGDAAELEERRQLIRTAQAGTPPTVNELPEPWRRLFRTPSGIPVAYLVPSRTSAMEISFHRAVESLVPVVRQGGKAWVLIALPLAQEHKPAIH